MAKNGPKMAIFDPFRYPKGYIDKMCNFALSEHKNSPKMPIFSPKMPIFAEISSIFDILACFGSSHPYAKNLKNCYFSKNLKFVQYFSN